MTGPRMLIADTNIPRANQLRALLGQAGITGVENVRSEADAEEPATALFVAADTAEMACSEALIEQFARCSPGAPIVAVSEAQLWESIRLAVRERAWIDVPHNERYDGLLTRYAMSRPPHPRIIMEESVARCKHLLAEWQASQNGFADLRLVSSLGEALETTLDSRAPVLLNLNIPSGAIHSAGISTLIYTLCPAVIAVMIEASHRGGLHSRFVPTQPESRFALWKPPFHHSDLKSLLSLMDVNWPIPSPP